MEEETWERYNSDGEIDLDAVQDAHDAKKAKKLLPPKVKKERPTKKTPEVDEDGELVVNMDYVQTKAKR